MKHGWRVYDWRVKRICNRCQVYKDAQKDTNSPSGLWQWSKSLGVHWMDKACYSFESYSEKCSNEKTCPLALEHLMSEADQ